MLKDEGRQKAGRVNHEVLHAMRKYLRIIARPARILEYIEFNEVGFISLLDQFEDSAREQNQYKLGKININFIFEILVKLFNKLFRTTSLYFKNAWTRYPIVIIGQGSMLIR